MTYLITAQRRSQFATVCAIHLAEVQTRLAQLLLHHAHVVLAQPADNNSGRGESPEFAIT